MLVSLGVGECGSDRLVSMLSVLPLRSFSLPFGDSGVTLERDSLGSAFMEHFVFPSPHKQLRCSAPHSAQVTVHFLDSPGEPHGLVLCTCQAVLSCHLFTSLLVVLRLFLSSCYCSGVQTSHPPPVLVTFTDDP